ncbi:glycosyltransferase family 2 protein [Nocardioides marmorisolisilvae]|uniref:Glycosyltransferase family 2 protein n=1 Tax=Nocardioides marmorisolisilvae TaxID=1542737 RepID=A0A3N0DTA3_9ACTN|nr:glycosyltransferase family 2 protein [Nocardioides marmorisolisilvae]RNL78633.1 glycosyltransferase family 2 protein [Nocardioides marmorisolisilvae]
MKVTALLVSHNGARWLPAVLAGLAASTRKIDAIAAVDTGSTDESVDLVTAATGRPPLVLDPRTPYGESVRVALASLPPAEADEWVWLLHDDSNPAPTCLEKLVEASEEAGDLVAVLGPKHREWPSLKRLLEVGVTLTGTGQRETGLERGEYDQGQHDEQHRVLAVNTAGMLVRREVLESVGLDPLLPVFGADLDFGWRVARAGYATKVIPEAVVFHVEASRQGRRDSELVEHPRRQEREGAQYTLLVNSPAWTIPFRSARMILGSLLRALGLLLVRAPGEAADEVAALLNIFLHPGRAIRARRARAGTAQVPHAEVRPLLAPFWLPYRHGLDYVTDIGIAVGHAVRDQAERRRPPGVTDTTPWFQRLLLSPTLWATLLALVAGHSYLFGGPLHGGALLPVPDGVGHWWKTWGSWRTDLGTGSDAPGPAYLLPLAVVATLTFNHPELVVDLIFLLAVPAAFAGALGLLRRISVGNVAPLWGAATYGLLPVLSGAVGQGRIGAVVGAAVLPWLVRAALDLGAEEPVRRWRSAWRVALLAGLLISFVPPAWLVLVLLALFAVVGGFAEGRKPELLIITLVPLVLVLPWAIGTLRAPGAWLVEGGRAASLPADPALWDLVLGRTGGVIEAPGWLAIGLPIAAVVAFIRPDTRAKVLQVWVVILAAAAVLAATSRVPVSLPGVPVEFRPWPGFLLILIQAGFIAAAAIAADGAVKLTADADFTWRQPVAAVTVVLAVLSPVLGVFWWLTYGGDGPMHRYETNALPTYMRELADGTSKSAVLRITGGLEHGLEYQVLRSGVPRLGDDGTLSLTDPDPKFRALVERLLSTADDGDAALLASYGVKYVYAPAPVADVVSGGFDAANDFGSASAPLHARAWVVQVDPSLTSVADQRAWLRPAWVATCVIGWLACLVLAAPERRRRRR